MTRPSDLTKGSVFQKYWRRLRKTADDIHNDYADLPHWSDGIDRGQAADQMKAAIALTLIEDDDSLRFNWEEDNLDCEPPEFDKGRKGEQQEKDWRKRHEEGEYVFYSLKLVKTFLDAEGNMDHDEAVDSLYCIELAMSRRGGRQADRDFKFLNLEAEMAQNYLHTTYGAEWWRPFTPERFANIELPDFDIRPMWERQKQHEQQGVRHYEPPPATSTRRIELDERPDEKKQPPLKHVGPNRRERVVMSMRLVGHKLRLGPGWYWAATSIEGAQAIPRRSGRAPVDWNRRQEQREFFGTIVAAEPFGAGHKVVVRGLSTLGGTIAFYPLMLYVGLSAKETVTAIDDLLFHGRSRVKARAQTYEFVVEPRADTNELNSATHRPSISVKLLPRHRAKPASYKRPIELDGLPTSLRFWED